MNIKKIYLFILLQFAFFPFIYAGAGSTSIDVLKIPVGIKGQGVGGAYLAACNDIEAIDYNPAGLKVVEKKQILFIHDIYLQDIFYDSIYYGQNINETGALGIVLKYLNSGRVIEQKENLYGFYDGEGKDISGFNYLLGIGYGMDFEKIVYNEFTKDLNIGGTLKISGESLGENYSNFSMAIDIGCIYDVIINEENFLTNRGEFLWNKAGFGIVFKNLGTSFNGNITPMSFELGAYTQFLNCFTTDNKVRISADFGYNLAESLLIKGGIEYIHFINNLRLSLRTGGNFSPEERLYSGINFGGGILLKTGEISYSIDYVLLLFSELGNNHKIGFSVIF